jgi:DTW domain-containing protein YfiP
MSHCLCPHISAVSNRTRVLVLQHPDEAKHPLNTGRLAVLGLECADLLIGEEFPQLGGIIASVGQAVLLFPAKDEAQSRPAAAYRGHPSTLLIVPDGTWRQARRIVRSNTVLSTLPRLSLPLGEPSAYRVRKAREPAAVSTIEAIVRVLSLVEPEQDFQPLLRPFDVLVAQQVQAMDKRTP